MIIDGPGPSHILTPHVEPKADSEELHVLSGLRSPAEEADADCCLQRVSYPGALALKRYSAI